MKVSIIVIGDEILLGRVTDTNSGFLSRTIDPLGWQVTDVATVADRHDDILDAIDRAMKRSDIVLTTGGLGPTRDDITKQALTDYFGGGLHLDEQVLDNARRLMESRGRAFNDLTATQAMVPDNCEVIVNTAGTAPIMVFDKDGHTLVAMPGVPAETETMFPGKVLPRLMERFGNSDRRYLSHRSLLVGGIAESAIAEHLASWEDSLQEGLHLAYLPNYGIVRLRIDGSGTDKAELEKLMDKTHADLAGLMDEWLLDTTERTLPQIVLDTLVKKSLTIATAESCTGGNIAHSLTLVPGSSAAVAGGVVAYSNKVKQHVLDVKAETLERHGAVSTAVAGEMAEGVRRSCLADVGVSTTGIAGPTGATDGKPVGTVCIAVSTPSGTTSTRHHFPGNRSQVIERATTTALVCLLKQLKQL